MDIKSLHQHFHWYYYHKGQKPLFSLVLAAFFWLFLAITQPFGIHSDGFWSFFALLVWLLPMGVFWVISIYLVDGAMDLVLRGKQREQIGLDLVGWLVKLVVVIHGIFLFRAYSCDWACMDLFEYLQLVCACLIIFLLVYLPFANYAKSVYLKSVFTGTERELADHEIQLGEGKSSLVISLPQVVYIQSDDNHLDIFLRNEAQEMSRETYRSTLIRMQKLLEKQHPSFRRVHRSYIVNLSYFKAFESASGSYRITLEAAGQEFTIPVSRKYKSGLRELI